MQREEGAEIPHCTKQDWGNLLFWLTSSSIHHRIFSLPSSYMWVTLGSALLICFQGFSFCICKDSKIRDLKAFDLRTMRAINLINLQTEFIWIVQCSYFLFYLNYITFYICLWRRKWQPTPVLLSGKFHGPRSLVGYSPWGRKESDMTEWLHFHFHFYLPLDNSACFSQGFVARY